MDWAKIGANIASIAPAIGSVLAGPAGGAAGHVLASVFGTEATPEAVDQAIQADPDAAAKLKAAELDHAVEMRRLVLTAASKRLAQQTQQQAAINETMRAELAAAGVFKSGWRSAIGWTMAASFLLMTAALCWAVIQDPAQLPNAVSGLMTMAVAMASVLGVTIHRASKERETAMTGHAPPSLLAALTGRTQPAAAEAPNHA